MSFQTLIVVVIIIYYRRDKSVNPFIKGGFINHVNTQTIFSQNRRSLFMSHSDRLCFSPNKKSILFVKKVSNKTEPSHRVPIIVLTSEIQKEDNRSHVIEKQESERVSGVYGVGYRVTVSSQCTGGDRRSFPLTLLIVIESRSCSRLPILLKQHMLDTYRKVEVVNDTQRTPTGLVYYRDIHSPFLSY